MREGEKKENFCGPGGRIFRFWLSSSLPRNESFTKSSWFYSLFKSLLSELFWKKKSKTNSLFTTKNRDFWDWHHPSNLFSSSLCKSFLEKWKRDWIDVYSKLKLRTTYNTRANLWREVFDSYSWFATRFGGKCIGRLTLPSSGTVTLRLVRTIWLPYVP